MVVSFESVLLIMLLSMFINKTMGKNSCDHENNGRDTCHYRPN